MQEDNSPFIPTDEQIEQERQRRDAAERERAAASLPIPLPATVDDLLAVAERYRRSILDAMQRGYNFLPHTSDNFIAVATGTRYDAVMTPDVRRVLNAAIVLDYGDAPSLVARLGDGSDEPVNALAVLDAVIAWCKTTTAPVSECCPEPMGRRRKQPCADAFMCYRLSLAAGRKQSELAEMLSRELRRPIGQPQVSRWIREVRLWLESGNVLPDLTSDKGPRPTVECLDPSKLDYVSRSRTRRVLDD